MPCTPHKLPPRLLLVDDSQDELQLLCDMLRATRVRLSVAMDGRQGYQRAVAGLPDLILMDVTMPQIDGFTAARLLKADPQTRHIPLIFLTAKNAPEERLQGFRLGGVDYISKPFLAEEVLARIHVHLGRTHHQPPTTPPTQPAPQRTPEEVIAQAATALIQDNLHALPPLPEIARLVGTHEKRLRQIFREQYGMTMGAYIGEERIRVAQRLLAETSATIQEIAEQVGMDNAGHFSTAFRSRTGVPPTAYRQALQTGKAAPQ